MTLKPLGQTDDWSCYFVSVLHGVDVLFFFTLSVCCAVRALEATFIHRVHFPRLRCDTTQ